MGEFSRALAQEEQFEGVDDEGKPKTYKLSPLFTEILGQWEGYLKAKGARELVLLKQFMPPDVWREYCKVHDEGSVAGRFDFFSPVSVEAQQTWEGRQELIYLRLQFPVPQGEPAFLRKMIRNMMETDLEKLMEIEAKMHGMDYDPNRGSPAAKPGQKNSPDAGTLTPSVPPSAESPGTSDPGKSSG